MVLEDIGGFSKEELRSVSSQRLPLKLLGEICPDRLIELGTDSQLKTFLQRVGDKPVIEVRSVDSSSTPSSPSGKPKLTLSDPNAVWYSIVGDDYDSDAAKVTLGDVTRSIPISASIVAKAFAFSVGNVKAPLKRKIGRAAFARCLHYLEIFSHAKLEMEQVLGSETRIARSCFPGLVPRIRSAGFSQCRVEDFGFFSGGRETLLLEQLCCGLASLHLEVEDAGKEAMALRQTHASIKHPRHHKEPSPPRPLFSSPFEPTSSHGGQPQPTTTSTTTGNNYTRTSYFPHNEGEPNTSNTNTNTLMPSYSRLSPRNHVGGPSAAEAAAAAAATTNESCVSPPVSPIHSPKVCENPSVVVAEPTTTASIMGFTLHIPDGRRSPPPPAPQLTPLGGGGGGHHQYRGGAGTGGHHQGPLTSGCGSPGPLHRHPQPHQNGTKQINAAPRASTTSSSHSQYTTKSKTTRSTKDHGLSLMPTIQLEMPKIGAPTATATTTRATTTTTATPTSMSTKPVASSEVLNMDLAFHHASPRKQVTNSSVQTETSPMNNNGTGTNNINTNNTGSLVVKSSTPLMRAHQATLRLEANPFFFPQQALHAPPLPSTGSPNMNGNANTGENVSSSKSRARNNERHEHEHEHGSSERNSSEGAVTAAAHINSILINGFKMMDQGTSSGSSSSITPSGGEVDPSCSGGSGSGLSDLDNVCVSAPATDVVFFSAPVERGVRAGSNLSSFSSANAKKIDGGELEKNSTLSVTTSSGGATNNEKQQTQSGCAPGRRTSNTILNGGIEKISLDEHIMVAAKHAAALLKRGAEAIKGGDQMTTGVSRRKSTSPVRWENGGNERVPPALFTDNGQSNGGTPTTTPTTTATTTTTTKGGGSPGVRSASFAPVPRWAGARRMTSNTTTSRALSTTSPSSKQSGANGGGGGGVGVGVGITIASRKPQSAVVSPSSQPSLRKERSSKTERLRAGPPTLQQGSKTKAPVSRTTTSTMTAATSTTTTTTITGTTKLSARLSSQEARGSISPRRVPPQNDTNITTDTVVVAQKNSASNNHYEPSGKAKPQREGTFDSVKREPSRERSLSLMERRRKELWTTPTTISEEGNDAHDAHAHDVVLAVLPEEGGKEKGSSISCIKWVQEKEDDKIKIRDVGARVKARIRSSSVEVMNTASPRQRTVRPSKELSGGTTTQSGGGTDARGEKRRRESKKIIDDRVVRRERAQSVTRKKPSADDERCFRQMFDKNTLRLMNRDMFVAALTHRTPVPEIASRKGADSDVKVIVRKRPIFPKEAEKDYDVVIASDATCTISNSLFQADLKVPFFIHSSFHFDNAFGENASNRDVYEETKDVIDFAANGGLGTIFMLGQTGSGKTHSMVAIEEYAAKDLFAREESAGIKVNFLEARANKVYDLLAEDSDTEVKLREVASGQYETEDVNTFLCRDADELIAFVRKGHKARATQCTEANDTSSRSHALCLLEILTSDDSRPSGKLCLVDCAGTERRKDSMNHSKERQTEGAYINASMHALKECIRLRSEMSSVPSHAYRASVLTKLLAEAFSIKNGKLIVICTVSPCATDTEHSLTTLRTGFALSGRPSHHLVETKQTGLKELVFGKPKVRHPMTRWNDEEVRQWLKKIGQEEHAVVSPGTTGHMLVRFPESRFVQVLGEKRGRRLYDLVRQEVLMSK